MHVLDEAFEAAKARLLPLARANADECIASGPRAFAGGQLHYGGRRAEFCDSRIWLLRTRAKVVGKNGYGIASL